MDEIPDGLGGVFGEEFEGQRAVGGYYGGVPGRFNAAGFEHVGFVGKEGEGGGCVRGQARGGQGGSGEAGSVEGGVVGNRFGIVGGLGDGVRGGIGRGFGEGGRGGGGGGFLMEVFAYLGL